MNKSLLDDSMYFHVTPPPAGAYIYQIAAKTPLARTTGKIGLTCPVCFLVFERHAYRVSKNVRFPATCSRACAAEVRRDRLETQCAVCGKACGQRKRSYALRSKHVCSPECSSQLQRGWTQTPSVFIETDGRGVRLKDGKYEAWFKGKYLGRFADSKDAAAARLLAVAAMDGVIVP